MIGEKIKKRRVAKGFSITELAKAAKVSKSYLSSIEKDTDRNPSLQVIQRIAAALDMKVDELVSTTSSPSACTNEEWMELAGRIMEAGGTKEDIEAFIYYLRGKNSV